MIARDPQVSAALGFHRDLVDVMEHGALRRLALSLATGDADGARLAARWFTDPAGAMEFALACIRDAARPTLHDAGVSA